MCTAEPPPTGKEQETSEFPDALLHSPATQHASVARKVCSKMQACEEPKKLQNSTRGLISLKKLDVCMYACTPSSISIEKSKRKDLKLFTTGGE
jgi:hypothetical protein